MKRLAVTAVAIAAVLGAGLLVSSSAAPEESRDTAVQQWEYKVVPYADLYKVLNVHDDEAWEDGEAWKEFARTMEARYNQSGKDGWELVSSSQMMAVGVFKRRR